ncbi:MAG TPA: DUF1592 domain-containing protein, partial [Polyangiaceae bacterium]|nr:DUF1592 domain-containing protein [Polyangiaceae bacterium]
MARLSHVQWENSVRDLLRLDEPSGLSDSFPMEAQGAGFLFDNPADSLQVEQALWGAYGAAASSLAQSVASSASHLGRLLPPTSGSSNEARARAFVVDFGQRAFRRPLSEAEVASYLEVYTEGVSAYADSSGFAAGVRLVIETMLQSPYFLYRIEAGAPVESGRALSDWELAQRLSYFLTNSMPDDALFDAARTGELATAAGVQQQVARLLGEPAAHEALRHFHDQLLNLPTYTGISPSPVLFPEVSPEFGSAALAST